MRLNCSLLCKLLLSHAALLILRTALCLLLMLLLLFLLLLWLLLLFAALYSHWPYSQLPIVAITDCLL
jgi:hypothetical protein